jgi:hypothetical protein
MAIERRNHMKMRILKLTPEQLAGALQGKAVAGGSKLPTDLEVLDCKVDLFTREVALVVRSECFEDIAESLPVPELNLSIVSDAPSGFMSPVSKPTVAIPVSAAKFEPKHELSPPIAKPVPPPVSRYAAKMENEFSPDQRKLLSFTVKGDSVVVKPVTFLKAEWDDINGVVRSLGGRWVKGDIISYWEIPLQ